MKKCCICKEIKPLNEFHKRNSAKDGHTAQCANCLNKSQNPEYMQEIPNDYVFAFENSRSKYYVSKIGKIYVKSKCKPLREVKCSIGSHGYLVFGNSVSYKRTVAMALIPNPKGCNEVHLKDGNQFNTHPDNLRWIWTRANRVFTPEQALQMTNDKYLLEFYQTGNKRVLDRGINNVFEKMYSTQKNEYIGELYLIINNYAQRNLLFNLKLDIIGTYKGLLKQRYRQKKIKTVQLNENYI